MIEACWILESPFCWMALVLGDGNGPFSMRMGGVKLLLLGCWLLQLCCLHTCCKVFEHPLGTVTDDQDLEIGSTLIFRCTLYNKTLEEEDISSSDIILKQQKDILWDTTVVDRSTVEYRLWNASAEDTGLFSCYAPLKNYTKPQLVCSSYIAVGYKPSNVLNFTCISLGYSNLTCTWVAPFNPVQTTYVLNDFLYNNEILSRRCPVTVANGCQFRLDTKPAYIQTQEYLNFIVIGNNSLGRSKQYFTLRHAEIIKPGLPHATTEDVSRTSLVLRLEAPRGLQNGEFPGGLIYSVQYYSISTKLDIIKVEFVEAESNARLLIEDLVPHTQYRFEVQCRLNFIGDHFHWSDIYNATETTLADVPYMAPVIDNSAFDVQVIAGNRTVTLYWKAVPSEFENGNAFHYVVKYHEHYIPKRAIRQASRSSSFSVGVGNKTSHSFEHMDTGTAYMFNIIAANNIGNSSNETGIVVVDKAEKFLHGPKDITVISYDQGSYDISWKSPDPSHTNFTLYWCETLKSRPAKCEGPLDWTSVVNKTSHKLYLPSDSTNYQFAVATVQNRKTSGMFWAPCTVLYGVTYKIRKIELVPKNSTSLKIRWSLKCEAEKRIIKEYAIYYCPFHGKCSYENARNCKVNGSGVMDWPNKRVVNMSQTEHILGPLDPFTCYFSYIRVRTDAGWGENSDFASEITMSSAPSGPPTEVHATPVVEDSKAASIRVSFNSPKTPNGVITRYKIFYNKTLSEGATFHKEVRVQAVHNEVTLENVFYYSNYSIEVAACVDQACSEKSEPVYVYTGISHPGIIGLPHVEVLDDDLNITWESPRFPNGPAQFYQVQMLNNKTNIDIVFNVTGENFLTVKRDCTNGVTGIIYSFKVRAVNFREGDPLYGEYSKPANTAICPSGFLNGYSAGIIVGIVIGFVFVVMIISYLARFFFRTIREVKKTQIKLPKGLESPLDVNPLSSYDKFKSGLQNSRDSGIPNDRAYDRLFSSSSEGDLKRADELAKRSQTARNPSGESGKGQDSISSANTTKTHNSLDSGAEVESPPSPDSFSSDGANTTPRAFKPGDITRVSQTNRSSGSRDSGLAKDDTRPIHITSLAMTARGRCFQPDMGAYKFAKKGVKYPSQTLSLSNSEPSVAEFDLDGSEPLVCAGMPPYCKLHLSNSAGNGLNAVPTDTAYSKWDGETFYRPLMSYRKVMPQHLQVFSAITVNSRCLTPARKKEPRLDDVGELGVMPIAYVSVSEVLNSAKGSGPSHRDRCELPGQLSVEETDDGSQQALLPRASGYVPVEISYPDLPDEVPEPDAGTCNVDLSEILPANFVIEHNGELGSDVQSNGMDNITDNAVPDGPCKTIVPNNLFHGGGRVFMNAVESKDNDGVQSLGDNWCELGTIQVDPDTYREQTDEVLTEQPITNGYSPFPPLMNESNISPAHVISRPNLANVPVESV